MAAFTQIQSLTADGTSGTFDFTSIAATFNHLRVVVLARSQVAAANSSMIMRLNNDSGANYDFNMCRGVNSAMTVAQDAAVTGFGANQFLMYIPGSTATASYPGILIVDVPFYAATTFFKQVVGFNYGQIGVAAASLDTITSGGTWRNTAAVTRVTLVTGDASNLVSGSKAILYGIT